MPGQSLHLILQIEGAPDQLSQASRLQQAGQTRCVVDIIFLFAEKVQQTPLVTLC
ncbi:hypothetical protein HY11_17490 [Hyphomonas pacifica]|nr:hypothetical protein HY11_17490 [Hyphomonas pacifica]